METKIRLTKVEEAPYRCHATYEWEGHIIEADTDTNFNGGYIWYCKTLFKDRMFRTLRGLKRAIQLKVEGKLTNYLLEECEDI